MLTSPALLSSWSSRSASTRASSGRSAGAAGSRPGGTAPGGSSGASPAVRSFESGRRRVLGAARVTMDGIDGAGARPGADRWRRGATGGLGGFGGSRATARAAAPARRVGRRRRPDRWRRRLTRCRRRIRAAERVIGARPGPWRSGDHGGRGRAPAGARRPGPCAAATGLPSAWILAMRPRAVGTPLPALTDSRMRASSSSADCARVKARSSGATTPLSICMNSVSSSWDKSPIGVRARHARAALERVQRALERREAVDAAAILVPLRQRALRGVDELDRFVGEDAGDVLVEIRDDVFRHVRRGARAAAAADRRKGSGRRRDRRRDGSPGGAAGGAAASSAARAAAMMRCSRCSVACSMRPSSAPCDWKKPVDSSRCAATTAWRSCNRRAARGRRCRGRRHCRMTCAPSARVARSGGCRGALGHARAAGRACGRRGRPLR